MPVDPNTSAVYRNKRGLENRITSFRCNSVLRKRLFDYAESVGRDPSELIREAIGEYLYKRIQKPQFMSTGDSTKSTWSAKSTKL